MKLLVIESSASPAFAAAVALAGEGARLAAINLISEPRALARDLIGAVDGVLAESAWSLAGLGAIVAGTGPGSWTSLRVGLTTAKTLAQALTLPLVGVPYFEALAEAVRATREPGSSVTLLTLAPCRPGEFYGAVYSLEGGSLEEMRAPAIDALECWVDFARSGTNPVWLAGESAPLAAEWFANHAPDAVPSVFPVTPKVLATAMARRAALRLAAGPTDSPLTLVPLYLAPSNAERNFLARP